VSHLLRPGLLRPPITYEVPQDHKNFHHVSILKLVLDGVRMVRTCLLKESLNVICQRLRLVLGTAFTRVNLSNVRMIMAIMCVLLE
jgi:hypothetical protein